MVKFWRQYFKFRKEFVMALFPTYANFVDPGQKLELRIQPNQLLIIRGRKLTDTRKTRVLSPYAAGVILTALPFDGTELHLHFGANGTYQTVVAQDPQKLMWGPQNEFVFEGQVFDSGDSEFSIVSDCGDESVDSSITAVLGFYPGKNLITVTYTVDKE